MKINLERLEELFAQIRERVKTAIANGVEVDFSDECGVTHTLNEKTKIMGAKADGTFKTVITVGDFNAP